MTYGEGCQDTLPKLLPLFPERSNQLVRQGWSRTIRVSGPNMNELHGYAEERVFGEGVPAKETPEPQTSLSHVKWWLLSAVGVMCFLFCFVFCCLSILLGVLR